MGGPHFLVWIFRTVLLGLGRLLAWPSHTSQGMEGKLHNLSYSGNFSSLPQISNYKIFDPLLKREKTKIVISGCTQPDQGSRIREKNSVRQE